MGAVVLGAGNETDDGTSVSGQEVAAAVARIGPQEVLRAVGGVRHGRVFDLGTCLGGEMPRGRPGMFADYRWASHHEPSLGGDEPSGFEYSMEVITGSLHQSSHIDGLAHVQAQGRLFGGATVEEAYGSAGWKVHGMETVSAIVGRGLLLDIPGALGVDRLKDDDVVDCPAVRAALTKQGSEVRGGDIVLVRTGKIQEYQRGEETYYDRAPGVDVDAGIWLYEQGMAVLGTDTSGTEPTPFADPSRTAHRALLVERGVYLLEILNLEELAAAEVYEFLFVCCPLKIVGATGSWVRPIAMI